MPSPRNDGGMPGAGHCNDGMPGAGHCPACPRHAPCMTGAGHCNDGMPGACRGHAGGRSLPGMPPSRRGHVCLCQARLHACVSDPRLIAWPAQHAPQRVLRLVCFFPHHQPNMVLHPAPLTARPFQCCFVFCLFPPLPCPPDRHVLHPPPIHVRAGHHGALVPLQVPRPGERKGRMIGRKRPPFGPH